MCISAFEGEGKNESAAMNAAVRAVEGIFFCSVSKRVGIG